MQAPEDKTKTKPQEEQIDPGCTCDAEYSVEPCPVHAQKKAEAEAEDAYAASQQPMIITDESIAPELKRIFEGYCFLCPGCGLGSILHTFKACPDCRTPVLIKSAIVSAEMRKINEKNKAS